MLSASPTSTVPVRPAPIISLPRQSSDWGSPSARKTFFLQIFRDCPPGMKSGSTSMDISAGAAEWIWRWPSTARPCWEITNEVLPGGYFLYDSTKELSEEFNRNDITPIGIPLTSLCNDAFQNPKLRQLLKNIIYVGALSFLIDLDFSILTESIERQFKKKPKLGRAKYQSP